MIKSNIHSSFKTGGRTDRQTDERKDARKDKGISFTFQKFVGYLNLPTCIFKFINHMKLQTKRRNNVNFNCILKI